MSAVKAFVGRGGAAECCGLAGGAAAGGGGLAAARAAEQRRKQPQLKRGKGNQGGDHSERSKKSKIKALSEVATTKIDNYFHSQFIRRTNANAFKHDFTSNMAS